MADLVPGGRSCVVLIGMRGAGKTAVGAVLGRLLGGPFVDLDAVVERRAGVTIAALFARHGEQGFRVMEREAVSEIMRVPPRVLSVGGGAMLDPESAARLTEGTVVVWLHAPPEVLWDRILNDPATQSRRPALTEQGGLEEIKALSVARDPIYARYADHRIDTTVGGAQATASRIAALLAGRS